MAQPTVARRIEALEHEIGLTLFERDTRGFRPTVAARALVPVAEAIEAAASRFDAAARDLGTSKPIRITAYSGNFSPRATAIFSAFSARHPEIKFEFLPGVRLLDLAAGEADVALRLTRSDPDPDLICRKISTARFSLYGSRGYAAKHGLPKSPDDLSGHTFVTYQRDDIPQAFHDWLMRHVAPEQIILSFSEIELVHAAIRAGQGLSIMNLRLAEDDPSLVRCFDPIAELTSQHLLLVAPQAYRRPEVKEFVKFFAPRYAAIFK